MKKDFINLIALICLEMVLFSVVALLTYEAFHHEETVNEREAFEPTPLIIETEKEDAEPSPGVYRGTVEITGVGMKDESYEGVMFVEMDGEFIRISCTDAVRSRFSEYF